MKSGMSVVVDKWPEVKKQIEALDKRDVLVGVPGENAERGEAMNNPTIGYIAEHGAPEVNVPARPWLAPGIRAAKDGIARAFKAAGQAALEGKTEGVTQRMHAAGLIAVASAKKLITQGIPPPLAESTLKARARRKAGRGLRTTKGAKMELESRAIGNAPSVDFAKPYIDSGNFLRSITHVIREKSRGRN